MVDEAIFDFDGVSKGRSFGRGGILVYHYGQMVLERQCGGWFCFDRRCEAILLSLARGGASIGAVERQLTFVLGECFWFFWLVDVCWSAALKSRLICSRTA